MDETKGYSIADFMARHLVTKVAIASDKRSSRLLPDDSVIGSGFMLVYRDIRIFVTAGHVIRDIEAAHKNSDWITSVSMIDSIHSGALFKKGAVNLIFDRCPHHFFFENDGTIDYGFMLLHALPIAAIQANDIVPVNYERWRNPPELFDQYFLIGTPAEKVDIGQYPGTNQYGVRSIRAAMIEVKRIVPPAGSIDTSTMIYGKIDLTKPDDEEPLNDIRGMSGCPLLGIQFDGGKAHYWIIAIQSGWFEEQRIITACRLKPFAEHIRDSIDQAIESFEN
jgi:hypothetical protein